MALFSRFPLIDVATRDGFTVYFGMTFLATIPSMALIPFLPHLEDPARTPATQPPPSDGE